MTVGPDNNSFGQIASAFKQAKQRQLAALMPYFTLGYPNDELSLEIISSIAGESDLLELGVPFSDPIADGPTIQRSTQKAIEQGISTGRCIDMVAELRRRGIGIPLLLMGYYNPILSYGEARFVRDAADAGVSGFIVPDLPPEEAGYLSSAAYEAQLALVHFLAPTSSPARIRQVIQQSKGFIYMVSVTGVTGARGQIRGDVRGFVQDIKRLTDLPIAVGFGISDPSQAKEVGTYADGVIVGSALINAVDAAKDSADDQVAQALSFVKSLRQALMTWA